MIRRRKSSGSERRSGCAVLASHQRGTVLDALIRWACESGHDGECHYREDAGSPVWTSAHAARRNDGNRALIRRPSSLERVPELNAGEAWKEQVGSFDLVAVALRGSVVTGERKTVLKSWLRHGCLFRGCPVV